MHLSNAANGFSKCVMLPESSCFTYPLFTDLNPAEQYFAEFKGFVKKNWPKYEKNRDQDFGEFLQSGHSDAADAGHRNGSEGDIGDCRGREVGYEGHERCNAAS
jgi:hypothetical protein